MVFSNSFCYFYSMEYTELWKTAVYDDVVYDNYQVSNLGNVKSLNYRRTGREELMKPEKVKNGYYLVGLRKNGEKKMCLVHRLVASTFLENPDNKPEVNHKSENKQDNRVENLEWVWHKDNINHGTRNERAAKARINGKRSKKVLQLSLTGELIREWESTAECGRNGFKQGAVCNCCNGKQKTYKGYIWKYKE